MIRTDCRWGLGLLLVLVAAPVAVAGQGECVRAEITEPYRLPDGSVQPAGTLTLCVSGSYSPVASLHKTYVNGRPIGVLPSRHRTGERGADSRAYLVFAREPLGTLRLLGYGSPVDDGRSRVYQLASPPVSATAVASARRGDGEEIYVAARGSK